MSRIGRLASNVLFLPLFNSSGCAETFDMEIYDKFYASGLFWQKGRRTVYR